MEQAHLKVIPDRLGRPAESYAVHMLIAAAAVCRRHDAGHIQAQRGHGHEGFAHVVPRRAWRGCDLRPSPSKEPWVR